MIGILLFKFKLFALICLNNSFFKSTGAKQVQQIVVQMCRPTFPSPQESSSHSVRKLSVHKVSQRDFCVQSGTKGSTTRAAANVYTHTQWEFKDTLDDLPQFIFIYYRCTQKDLHGAPADNVNFQMKRLNFSLL